MENLKNQMKALADQVIRGGIDAAILESVREAKKENRNEYKAAILTLTDRERLAIQAVLTATAHTDDGNRAVANKRGVDVCASAEEVQKQLLAYINYAFKKGGLAEVGVTPTAVKAAAASVAPTYNSRGLDLDGMLRQAVRLAAKEAAKKEAAKKEAAKKAAKEAAKAAKEAKEAAKKAAKKAAKEAAKKEAKKEAKK